MLCLVGIINKSFQMKTNIIKDKSFLFAVAIVNLYKYLAGNKKEYVMSRQLINRGSRLVQM